MKRVVVIGGGYAGMAAAHTLLKQDGCKVTVVEKNPVLGGLAGSFEHAKKFFPLGYHHILQGEKHLLGIIKELGLEGRLAWKPIKMLFHINGLYDLRNPLTILRLPLSFRAKARFVAFMLRCFLRKNWGALENTPADEWLLKSAGREVKEVIFDRLIEIKFGMDSSKVSAAWLGARLAAREGSSKFGCMPGADWTREVINGLENSVKEKGGIIICGENVQEVLVKDNAVKGVRLENGKIIGADIIVSAVPTTTFVNLLPSYKDDVLEGISYINTVSCIVGTKQKLPDFYWAVALQPKMSCAGVFNLTNLNPSLGNGETVVNFFTHLQQDNQFFSKDDEAILKSYKEDFRNMFGFELQEEWVKINRITDSSPNFVKGYKNPVIKGSVEGLFFAGNYRTYPWITSTNMALASGIEAAKVIVNG